MALCCLHGTNQACNTTWSSASTGSSFRGLYPLKNTRLLLSPLCTRLPLSGWPPHPWESPFLAMRGPTAVAPRRAGKWSAPQTPKRGDRAPPTTVVQPRALDPSVFDFWPLHTASTSFGALLVGYIPFVRWWLLLVCLQSAQRATEDLGTNPEQQIRHRTRRKATKERKDLGRCL